MKTFMFPGQGSQSKGMGGDLFDEFKSFTAKADKILGYSIKELCLKDPKNELGKTQFTQPALYTVNAFSYFKKVEETGKEPDFLIGHSLGEFNALLAAKCFDFEAGLKLVKKRGELMSQASNGGMAAIINVDKAEIEALLDKHGLKNIDLANFNSPSQIVISGKKDEIAQAQSIFQQGKMMYFPLNTSGAFHSRFMKPSGDSFGKYLNKFKLSELKVPVISNVTAKPYKNNEIAKNLSSQISSAVRWSESVQYLMSDELNLNGEMEFEELGHGDVLSKLVHKIKKESSNKKDKNITTSKTNSPKKPEYSADKSKEKNTDSKNINGKKPAEINSSKKTVTAIKSMTADEKVSRWNRNHPIGTKVKSLISDSDYDDLETRTEATVLFGHRAAIYMKGYNGYFDLDEITTL